MLSKLDCQIFIVTKILQAKGETHSYLVNHISGQIRALISVISGKPAPFNDYLPDLLEMAEIPYIDNNDGDLGFDIDWLISVGFDLSNPQKPKHPKFNETW